MPFTLEPWIPDVGGESSDDWHPGPRYTGKCTGCGRFVAKAATRLHHSIVTGETVEIVDCPTCKLTREVE